MAYRFASAFSCSIYWTSRLPLHPRYRGARQQVQARRPRRRTSGRGSANRIHPAGRRFSGVRPVPSARRLANPRGWLERSSGSWRRWTRHNVIEPQGLHSADVGEDANFQSTVDEASSVSRRRAARRAKILERLSDDPLATAPSISSTDIPARAAASVPERGCRPSAPCAAAFPMPEHFWHAYDPPASARCRASSPAISARSLDCSIAS
jgi:hypothetical protein